MVYTGKEQPFEHKESGNRSCLDHEATTSSESQSRLLQNKDAKIAQNTNCACPFVVQISPLIALFNNGLYVFNDISKYIIRC